MLTQQEKEDLYSVISSTIGHDSSIKNCQPFFNEQTVEVVEDLVNSAADCNTSMKFLVANLAGGSSFLAKGILRKLLARFSQELKRSQSNAQGAACLVMVKAGWKREIVLTTIGA